MYEFKKHRGGQYKGQGVYCGLTTAFEIFFMLLLPNYTNILLCFLFLFALLIK